MERAELKLVTGGAAPASSPRRTGPAVRTGVALLALAAAATILGANRARRPVRPREIARENILQAIELGSGGPQVREAMVTLRRALGRRPMDAYTRAVYAAFVLAVSRGPEDARLAAFQADRAAELAPVTVPVVRQAAHVLVRTGSPERTVELIREMFHYDPDAAATLLAELEPLLPGRSVERCLVDTPEAWLAWWQRLQDQRRGAEAERVLAEARGRWPEELTIQRRVAQVAHASRRWDELRRLLPPDRELPDVPAASLLYGYRARYRAELGDAPGARGDVDRALELRGDDVTTLSLAAETLERLGDTAGARRHWTRALFLVPASGDDARRRLGILERLARLEEREDSPARALRRWRSVLELDPDHAEARRRVDELTGFRR
jgi:tetratricopeptide (TPR) repeat protein